MVKYVNTNKAFDSSVPIFKELPCQNIMVHEYLYMFVWVRSKTTSRGNFPLFLTLYRVRLAFEYSFVGHSFTALGVNRQFQRIGLGLAYITIGLGLSLILTGHE